MTSEEKKEGKKKVLIIDDNQDLVGVLKDKLDASGFETSSAGDGEEGLAKALAEHPDLVLLDMIMPKMDGMTMLEKLRSDEWGKKCKVIVLTLIEEADMIAKTVEFNILGYVVKTNFTMEGIVEQIKLALKD